MTGATLLILLPVLLLGFILGRKWQRIVHWTKKVFKAE